MNHKVIVTILIGCVLLPLSGCQLLSVILSPGSSDARVEPDFDLMAANKESQDILRVAVVVDQASYIRSELNLRYNLTNAVNALLTAKLKLDDQQLIDYKEIAMIRNSEPDFSRFSPVEAGKRLGCDYVIFASIVHYDLHPLPEKEYYAATAKTIFSFHGVNENKRLMPLEKQSKTAEIEIELEKGLQQSVSRICRSTAYCIVRDLYPVPRNEYDIMDEKRKMAWD
ncbi:hypothetical protein SMSP2_00313 [Limihaloglobus sulfuriphilus]|uniref:Lipoprotein n=1 Tax=Limihaloglobus sulfuriphilus TaxID=1851148 RepID=A0A1Q2MBA8_9BACT|nr:hypothetical protein [Limihaloglobus sulfuriphilus]AQQ69976.1 hypothetical protein SMSP2_00313 [Limihaloglobus sulfuriphilus]